jgi:uncharacterized cupredoxin-like copper-binding protein
VNTSSARPAPGKTAGAETILRERLAAGAIDEEEFRRRVTVLREGGQRTRPWKAIALAAFGVVAIAGAAGGLAYAAQNTIGHSLPTGQVASCQPPQLPGQVVDVTLSDMNMMSGGMMQGGGMFGITVSPKQVHTGTVSLRVINTGSLQHELVVLPLASGGVGEQSVGPDGRVKETGSLGEASATCAPGAGSGIASGAAGWVTLQLPVGRYELICNFPWHYAMGMHAELDVTA